MNCKNTKIKSKKILKKRLKQKERRFRRGMTVLSMIIFLLFGGLNKAYALEINNDKMSFSIKDIGEKKLSMVENIIPIENNINKDQPEDNDSEEQEEIAEEENNKKEKEEEKKYKNTSDKGQQYIYDASIVSQKLKKCDYGNDGKKIVFLTFDDGASNTVTPKILDILDKYDVKATFFIMGKVLEDGGEKAQELVKEEYEKGHAIGNHSYSHEYNILYPGGSLNLESFKKDYSKNEEILKSIIGEDFSTRVIRCPGGYMSWHNMDKLDPYLQENNLATIDWSALSKDAEGKKKNADELVQCAVETSKNQELVVLLMHDTYGKEETAKSLPGIIEHFKSLGYEFRTLG